MLNVVETLREAAINNLFRAATFSGCFGTWRTSIDALTPARTPRQIINLGDHLSEIFRTTGTGERGQGDVSGGGAAWESLICWYLNLCLIGRRTVVIKHHRSLIPAAVSDAITVNYHNFVSNTESDLIAITFPDLPEYCAAGDTLRIADEDGHLVPLTVGVRTPRYNLAPVMNALCHRDFTRLEIHVIQCKTNWNDNAQIPMLWDMVYSATGFGGGVTVGRNGLSISAVAHFTYSFVTVPTSRIDGINATSTCVQRVRNISGGNYWGRETRTGIANSVKEMLGRNLASGHAQNHLTTLGAQIPRLGADYPYFGL